MEAIASDWIARAGHGFAIDESRFVVSGINADASLYAVVLVNAGTGVATLVRQDPYEPEGTARLRPDLVNDRWVLFTVDPLFDLLHEDESSPLSVLDLETGEILVDVGTIARP